MAICVLAIINITLLVGLYFELQWFKDILSKAIDQNNEYMIKWCKILDKNYQAMEEIIGGLNNERL